jgi:hypothetical protein
MYLYINIKHLNISIMNNFRKPMNKMTPQELVNHAIKENFTLAMIERYNVDTDLLAKTLKGQEEKLDLELRTELDHTYLYVNGWMQCNVGCKRKNFTRFGKVCTYASANVYRSKNSKGWYFCKFSKSETPTNKMTKEELKYWEFVGIATFK